MLKADLPEGKMIILFDGVCNFCDSTVRFLIRRDRKDVFRFAPLQSDIGKEIAGYPETDSRKTDSIVLYEPGKGYYYKSEAALKIARGLGGIWSAAAIVCSALPKSCANLVYDYFARNRYKWFGQKTECMIPSPEMRAKFLE